MRILFNRNRTYSGGSLSRLAWLRLRRDKLAMASLAFIALLSLAAILGYLITPDSTPFANEQHLELGTLKPGTKVEFIQLRKEGPAEQRNWFRTMMSGKRNHFTRIPYSSVRQEGDRVIITEYSNVTGEQGPEVSYRSEDVITIADSRTFWFGTDRYGRDVLSMLLIGARVSLSVGLISVLISLVVGIFAGAAGGYFGGRTDHFIVWLINVVWSIPTLLLVIAITFALGRGFWQVFIAVGLTMWVEVARVVRGQVLSIREKEFVEAARALGFSDFRIIFRHLMPNVISPVIVISAGNFASAILMEAGLSFLGIGVRPPMPSWGSMIRDNYAYIILDKAYLAILPGAAIMLVVLAFMLLGNGLRDALDVRIQEA